jgi:hypothetical protein
MMYSGGGVINSSSLKWMGFAYFIIFTYQVRTWFGVMMREGGYGNLSISIELSE